jgi:hypothetical protein
MIRNATRGEAMRLNIAPSVIIYNNLYQEAYVNMNWTVWTTQDGQVALMSTEVARKLKSTLP